MNPDISAERRKGTFNTEDVAIQLYGKDGLYIKRLAQKRAGDDPDFKIAECFSQMPRDEAYNESVRMYASMIEKAKDYGYLNLPPEGLPYSYTGFQFYQEAVFIGTIYPHVHHNSMFLYTIHSQATEDQKARWLPCIETHEIIGTYSQSELGHGTFLKGLETTATYDKTTEEFILNSPTITSIKFWPAGLGKTCNHAIVMAALIIDGKNYGTHTFMVQLRLADSHKPMPGVELGDNNAKFGYDNVDNGYMKFSNHRIPRTDMLMKYAEISPEGKYIQRGIPEIAQLTLVFNRIQIVLGSANGLAMAATIATRYSAVRRQTANSKGVEPQVLDYQTQQMKLFPAISAAYALFFCGLAVRDIYFELQKSAQAGNTLTLAKVACHFQAQQHIRYGMFPSQKKYLPTREKAFVYFTTEKYLLWQLHCLTSCLKAYSSETACQLIEICRQSCGGHGYSQASGIPRIYLRCVPCKTFEGENTVMYLQCAQSLVNYHDMAKSGKKLPEGLMYIGESPTVPHSMKLAEKLDIPLYLTAFKLNLLRQLHHVAGSMQNSICCDSVEPDMAWNNHSVALMDTAKANAQYLTALMFSNALFKRQWTPASLKVMKHVCEFFMVNTVLEQSGSFLQNSVLTSQQVTWIVERRVELLKLIRPNAVALADAYDYPDRLLNSCLGRYDGNVYEALYEYAKNSALNKTQVHPSYYKYIKPMQEALKVKAKL